MTGFRSCSLESGVGRVLSCCPAVSFVPEDCEPIEEWTPEAAWGSSIPNQVDCGPQQVKSGIFHAVLAIAVTFSSLTLRFIHVRQHHLRRFGVVVFPYMGRLGLSFRVLNRPRRLVRPTHRAPTSGPQLWTRWFLTCFSNATVPSWSPRLGWCFSISSGYPPQRDNLSRRVDLRTMLCLTRAEANGPCHLLLVL